jgi:hypothetical protein
VISIVFHSGPGLPGRASGLVSEYSVPGHVIVIFVGFFRLVIDLHFVTVVHRHPRLAGLDRNTNVNSGVIVVIAHLVHHADHAIAELSSRPVEQTHPTMSVDQPIFDGHLTGADVLSPHQIFPIK